MILFFDTETSGLPNFNERARHDSQPHSAGADVQACKEIYFWLKKGGLL